MSEQTKTPYSFIFDQAKDAWICSIHGDVQTAWVRCWNGCQDGFFDGYEEDPFWYDEGELIKCSACAGEGGFTVCGECNINNPDAEF